MARLSLPRFGIVSLVVVLVCLSWSPTPVSALHLQGKWNSSRFFLFLARFGIQKTVMDEPDETRGYIFGNVTLIKAGANSSTREPPVTLLVVDSDFFLDVYGNAMHWDTRHRTATNQQENALQSMCERMLSNADKSAWHMQCNPRGALDLYRSVPCPKGALCKEEDDPKAVQPGHQFTFTIQDVKQPRYWYLMMVSCVRNSTTCRREATAETQPVDVEYDIWLVNGSPQTKSLNMFEYQFSFEFHDTAELYLVFTVCYLATALFYQIRCNESTFSSRLLLAHLWLVTVSCCAMLTHELIFAHNGVGWIWLWYLGFWARHALADSILLTLLVILSHEGFLPAWPLTPPSWSAALVAASARGGWKPSQPLPWLPMHRWLVLITFAITASIFHIWCAMDQDSILDVDMWESAPGGLLLALRFSACLWFFYQLLQLHRLRDVDGEATLVPGASGHRPHGSNGVRTHEEGEADDDNGDDDLNAALLTRSDSASRSRNHLHKTSRERGQGALQLHVEGEVVHNGGWRGSAAIVEAQIPPDLVHVAAGYLVWALALPLSVLVAEDAISALWRLVTVLSVTYSADYLAAVFTIYILWRSKQSAKPSSVSSPLS